MIEETAVVVQCQDNYAWVETERKTACGQCTLNKGCGTAVLSKLLGNRISRVKALNPLAAKEGETVVVGLPEDVLLRGSVMVYLVPLVMMIVFALLGEGVAEKFALASSEPLSIVFAIIGLLLSAVWIRRYTGKINRDKRYQPVILRRFNRVQGGFNPSPI